jgi:hypothetical protein
VKDCAAKPEDCVGDRTKKMEVCKLLTLNLENPDLEGDVNSLKDALLIAGTANVFTAGLPAGTRILESVENLKKSDFGRFLAAADEKGYIAPQTEGGMVIRAGFAKLINLCMLSLSVMFFMF